MPPVLEPALFARLAPYLLESVAIVNAEGRVRAMLGPPGGLFGVSDVIGRHIFEYCREEDVPRAAELAVEALNSSPGWSATWTVRLARADGSSGEYELRIENHQDDPEIDGFIVRLRELAPPGDPDAPIFASELGAELESLAGAVPLPILFVGPDANLYFQNDAGREFCRQVPANLYAEGFASLASPEDRAELEFAVGELLGQPGERVVCFRLAGTPPSTPRMVEARLSGLGQGSRVLALVATLVDVTDRVAAESELRQRASSDPLTGLLNRRGLDEVLAARLARAAHRVTALYADLDGFKAVNDTHGHDAGDEFLLAVAAILRSSVRDGDVVARIGGDEFVVVLDAPAAAASKLAQRIDEQIAAHARTIGVEVRASVGVAIGTEGDSPRDLRRRADRAMYEVKRTRRLPS